MPVKGCVFLLACNRQYINLGAQVDCPVLRRENGGVRRGEVFAFSLHLLNRLCEPVNAENDIQRLSCEHNHISRARLQDIFIRAHYVLRFPLCLLREGDVHSHLVAVEVRVERVADERMELDSIAFDESWTKCLNTLTVESRRAIE